jgi:hypothetical protein
VSNDHPLRAVREIVNAALAPLSPEFKKLCARLGRPSDAPMWDVTVFTKNHEHLVEGEIASKFMAAVLSQPRVKELLSSEHFSVDGTLIDDRGLGQHEELPPEGRERRTADGGPQ